MMRTSVLMFVPAAVGIVLALPGTAAALCMHGLFHCGTCHRHYYYNSNPGGTPTLTPAGVGGVTSPAAPPGMAPVLAFPGAGMNQPAPQLAPAAFGGSFASAAPTVSLSGYNSSAQILSVPPGTPLTNGHLFGSHIFQVLRQFGARLDKSGLLELAAKAFADVNKFLPTGIEASLIEEIVDRFIRTNGSPDPDTVPPNPVGTTVPAAGVNTFRVVAMKPTLSGGPDSFTIETSRLILLGSTPSVGAAGGAPGATAVAPPAAPPGMAAASNPGGSVSLSTITFRSPKKISMTPFDLSQLDAFKDRQGDFLGWTITGDNLTVLVSSKPVADPAPAPAPVIPPAPGVPVAPG